jgi:hypothetical protein
LAREYNGDDDLLRIQREIAVGIARWQVLALRHDAVLKFHQVMQYHCLGLCFLTITVAPLLLLEHFPLVVKNAGMAVLAFMSLVLCIYWFPCFRLGRQLYLGEKSRRFKRRVERILRTRPREVDRAERSALLRIRGALEVREPKLAWMGCVEELKVCITLPNLIYWYELGEFLRLLQLRTVEGFSFDQV